MPAEVNFFNVGQGDCTLIVFYGKDPTKGEAAVLVDFGTTNEISHKFNGPVALDTVRMYDHVPTEIVKKLAALKSPNTLDLLILTHPDQDHYNLMSHLLFTRGATEGEKTETFRFKVRNVLYAGKLDEYTNIRVRGPHMKKVLQDWDKHKTASGEQAIENVPRALTAEVVTPELLVPMPGGGAKAGLYLIAGMTASPDLGPPAAKKARSGTELPSEERANRHSIALMLLGEAAAGGKAQRVFLMADTGHEVESVLMSRTGPGWDIGLQKTGMSWLKAGHHGSAVSTTPEWLDFIKPDGIFISAGTSKNYKHPRLSHLKKIMESWKSNSPVIPAVQPNVADTELPGIGYFADIVGVLPRTPTPGKPLNNFLTEPGVRGVATSLVRYIDEADGRVDIESVGYDWHLTIDSRGPNTYLLTYS
ncbi:ComEC/Rec2 family competence protein [Streptomyces sp. CA2R101]|uniref:ComEC/Rec2 family competence protein n=1 Tax=Streptomyces sp. CA2R101 TaxID=3120152 RepID=UPI0030090BCF